MSEPRVYQCGCILCVCPDEWERCGGCGAKSCGQPGTPKDHVVGGKPRSIKELLDSESALQSDLAALRARVAELEDEIAHGWRPAVALLYADTGLYTDDGELSDSRAHPFIDFKRDSFEEIERKRRERGTNWLRENRERAQEVMDASIANLRDLRARLEAANGAIRELIDAGDALRFVPHALPSWGASAWDQARQNPAVARALRNEKA